LWVPPSCLIALDSSAGALFAMRSEDTGQMTIRYPVFSNSTREIWRAAELGHVGQQWHIRQLLGDFVNISTLVGASGKIVSSTRQRRPLSSAISNAGRVAGFSA
jgi:hypothetical protein